MKKKQAEELIYLEDNCPECKKGKMEVVFDTWFDGEKYYYIKCNECDFKYDG